MGKRVIGDLDFLRRTYRTTLIIGAMITLLLCATGKGVWVINYSLGVLTSLCFFKVTEWFVTQTFRAPHEGKPKRRWSSFFMVGKYFALVLGLYSLDRLRYFDGLAFLGGLVTLKVVLILKLFGSASGSR